MARTLLYPNRCTRKEYLTWYSLRRRCTPGDVSMFRGKGKHPEAEVLCDRWQVFTNFLKDLGPAPSPDHTLLRPDTTRPFEPGNLVWATRSQKTRNAGNKRRYLTFRGQTLHLRQWARLLGMRVETLFRRLNYVNWTLEEALTTPVAAHGAYRSRHEKHTPEVVLQKLTELLAEGCSPNDAVEMVRQTLGLD